MSKEKHIAAWMLERYLLGELPRRERRRIEKELERDPALRAELEELRASDRQILASYPAEHVIPEILKRAALARPRPAAPRHWRLAWLAGPALALALFLLVILPPLIQHRLSVPEDYIASKGGGSLPGPNLQLYRKSGDGERMLRDGDTARAGDRLQLAYIPGEQTHGVIFSIDGAGSITLHFPEKADGSTALKRGRRIFLAYSFELDRAPVFERFFFISARQALPTAAILAAAEKLAADPGRAMSGTLDLPAGCRQSSLLIRK